MVAAARALRLLCWEGYDSADILAPFDRQAGVRVHARTLLSDADTAARLASGGHRQWDVLNINNAYVRDVLYPLGLIRRLDPGRFGRCLDNLHPSCERLSRWAHGHDGALIGLCQRFGPFNLVVNTRRIGRACAEDQGFDLARDPRLRGRYGVLRYEDFNIFHVCIGAGLNPFERLDADGEQRFEALARSWVDGAALVTEDHAVLNRALIDGNIDFYLSGGIYTASPARLSGHREVRAITPRRGPIAGRGAIVFTEITSILEHETTSPHAEDFLEYLVTPEVSRRVAFVAGTHNPVAQMGDPRVRAALSAAELDAIQWDSLEEDVEACAEYDLVPNHATLLPRLRRAFATGPK